ncbi:MAG: DUF4476 domain-containing protein [Bacteroidia bacterium]
MKRIILLLVLLNTFSAWAQSTLNLFTQESEKFILFLNGVQQNASSQSNVKVENITASVQKLKIVFDDKAIQTINENIYYEAGKEYTYNVRKKNTTANNVKRIDGKSTTPIIYVVRLLDMKPLSSKSTVKNTQVIESTKEVDGGNNSLETETNDKVTTTTTVTKSNNTSGNENVNLNVGINGVGINMNINGLDATDKTVVTNTTTTTTKTITKNVSTPVKTSTPKVNEPVCAPMTLSTFNALTSQLKKQSFEDNKLQIIRQVLASNCINTVQVKQLIGEFTFEENKLKVAKMCYKKTTDKGNYFTLNDSFSFSSSADELNEFLQSKGAVSEDSE